MFASGSGNVASLYSTAGNWDTVNGSNGTLYENGTQTFVVGGGDTIAFAGSGNAVTASGNNDLFAFGAALGLSTINGFNSSDAMQFSKSAFASFQALQPHNDLAVRREHADPRSTPRTGSHAD